MKNFFQRFKKKNDPSASTRRLKRDTPLIGSELCPDGPQTARDVVRPKRLEVQREYRQQGRHPDELAKIPKNQRDESFWTAYVDALMVFEREEEALRHVERAVVRYPRNPLLAEMRELLRMDLGLADNS